MNENIKQSPNVQQAVPFLMIPDMNNALEFYCKTLGFKLSRKWEPAGKIEWCWLQLDAASIMLQEFKANLPEEKLGVGVSIYFICEDALRIYQQIISQGLSVPEPFVGNNMWVVGLKDPGGYHIFFESPTEVPEETLYSDWLKTKAN
jgi:lactoylglutathione lyase